MNRSMDGTVVAPRHAVAALLTEDTAWAARNRWRRHDSVLFNGGQKELSAVLRALFGGQYLLLVNPEEPVTQLSHACVRVPARW